LRIAHRVATVLTTIALLAPATISSAQSVATSPIGPTAATPIKHVVVIFQENVSFDHYFGTYPRAANPGGEPRFTATTDTPSVNGLDNSLLTNNPNAAKPFRLVCPSWSSPRGPASTTSTTASPISPRSSGSLKTTGAWVGSATSPSTRGRAR